MANESKIYNGIQMFFKVQYRGIHWHLDYIYIYTIKIWSQFKLDTHEKIYLANQSYLLLYLSYNIKPSFGHIYSTNLDKLVLFVFWQILLMAKFPFP